MYTGKELDVTWFGLLHVAPAGDTRGETLTLTPPPLLLRRQRGPSSKARAVPAKAGSSLPGVRRRCSSGLLELGPVAMARHVGNGPNEGLGRHGALPWAVAAGGTT
jgi:hypothetical protein